MSSICLSILRSCQPLKVGKCAARAVKRAGKYGNSSVYHSIVPTSAFKRRENVQHSSSSVILLSYGRRLYNGGKMGGIRHLIRQRVGVYLKKAGNFCTLNFSVTLLFLGTCWISGEQWLASRTFL